MKNTGDPKMFDCIGYSSGSSNVKISTSHLQFIDHFVAD
jgi:hypothetical protein